MSTVDPFPRSTTVDPQIAGYAHVPGGLLPALHALQHRDGYVDRAHIPALADVFNLSVAEVHGVISFYTDFRTVPPVGPVVQVCRAEACQARGADQILDRVRALGDEFTVQEVFCLGLCARGPAVAVDGEAIADVRADHVEVALRSVLGRRRAEAPAPGPGAPVLYVPHDALSRAVGADSVAEGFEHGAAARVVRTGSRGMHWLEPMIEVGTPDGRIAYGPVHADDVASLLAADVVHGGEHPLRLGRVDDLPWMANQRRVTFARTGVIDPRSLDDHLAHGGMVGLRNALARPPAEVVQQIIDSGLRGRGGAAFPAGVKLRTVLETPAPQKYVVCNADEGDSGAFADRMLMEGDPFLLLEGMAIAGWAAGATDGYVYIRSEYPDAIEAITAAIAVAEREGWLTPTSLSDGELADWMATGRVFRLHVRVGAGAYICGEETALLESIEGRRGVVRAKPPVPAVAGLWGHPTVVNNVLTLAALPSIMAAGPEAYAALGSGRSRGTQVVQLAGNVARGGLIEVPFGRSLHDIVYEFGGGTASGRPVRAVQVGGPLGAYLPADQLDIAIDYEVFAEAGALLGHGSVVVFDDTVDMSSMARFAMEFCAAESCGKCTPCRIGSTRGVELIDRIRSGEEREANVDLLLDLCDVMADASLCAMGGFTPLPVRSALTHFGDDFHRPVDTAGGATV